MRLRWVKAAGLFGLLALAGGYAEHRYDLAGADTRIAMLDPRTVTLKEAPIRQDWILEGHPNATSAEIGHTHDGGTQFLVWRTSAGRFNWFYEFDESVTVLDGEVFLTDGANAAPGNPAERRLGPGDVVFFHVGSKATWRVPDHVRKVATIRYPLPGPVASLARWVKTVRSWASPTSAMASL